MSCATCRSGPRDVYVRDRDGTRPDRRARRGLVLGTATLCALLLSGCNEFGFDVRSFPCPVMVSPQLRVGDAPETKLVGSPISKVEGEATSSSTSAASTYQTVHGGDVYQVSESYYGQAMSDDIYASLCDATGRRYDTVVVIDELRASELGHMSLFGHFELGVSVEGEVYERDRLRFEEERP